MDLEVYFYDNGTGFSRLIRELLEYLIGVVEEKYELSIYYEERFDPMSEYPYMVINDLPPIIFDEEPDIDKLVKIFVMASKTPTIYNGFTDYSNIGLKARIL